MRITTDGNEDKNRNGPKRAVIFCEQNVVFHFTEENSLSCLKASLKDILCCIQTVLSNQQNACLHESNINSEGRK